MRKKIKIYDILIHAAELIEMSRVDDEIPSGRTTPYICHALNRAIVKSVYPQGTDFYKIAPSMRQYVYKVREPVVCLLLELGLPGVGSLNMLNDMDPHIETNQNIRVLILLMAAESIKGKRGYLV